ncbi:MAG: aldo/keto reductase, partial [Longimicrobiales bacterium]
LLERAPEDDVLATCERLDIAFIPFFPLASGLLTGKYRRNQEPPAGSRLASGWKADTMTDETLDVVERLIAFAESRGHSILELAFSWLLAHPQVASVIAGATKPEQVRANSRAAAWRLTQHELTELDAALNT